MRRLHLLELFELLSIESMLGEKMASEPKENGEWNKTVEELVENGHTIRKETWTSKDGSSRYVRTFIEPKQDYAKIIKALEEEMKAAVEKEEYEKAAALRDRIKEIKK